MQAWPILQYGKDASKNLAKIQYGAQKTIPSSAVGRFALR